MATLNLSASATFAALRALIQSVVPAGIEVIKAQVNRVPEPLGLDWIEMTPLFRERLATNVDVYTDCQAQGSISGATLTVTSPPVDGPLQLGCPVYGVGVAAGTSVTKFAQGTGGVGTYVVSPPQTVAAGQLYFGTASAMMETKVTIQLDVHGPGSEDNAQILATLFRDDYSCEFLAAINPAIQPLYMETPRQTAFVNGESQYEDRWTIDAVLQTNPIVLTPQQFADVLTAGLISVDVVYPP